MDEYEFDHETFSERGSALRVATEENPRNLPCPTCEYPNRLTPKDVAMGYQCNSCAKATEHGWEIDYWEPNPKIHLGTVRIESEDGESYTVIETYKVDADLTDIDITEWVEDEYASEHCQHEYDCCGKFYANKGEWATLTKHHEGGKLIAVTQSFRLNI